MWWYILPSLLLLSLCKSEEVNKTLIQIVPTPLECQNGPQCYTLSQCLGSRENTSLCFASNTELRFTEGEHLANGIEKYLILDDVNYLTLVGDYSRGRPAARIRCNTTKGFAIMYAAYVQVIALEFIDCGMLLPKTLQERAFTHYTKTYLFTPTPIKAALFFVYIEHLQLKQCHLNNSDGFGLFTMNIFGASTVRDSIFLNSNRQALRYNLSHCRPDSLHTQDCMGGNAAFLYQDFPKCRSKSYTYTNTLVISNSQFLNGVNMDYEAGGWYYPPNYIASAGGLSIFSGQTSYNVIIQVHNVTIDSNIGYTGANLVVFVHDRYGTYSDTIIHFDNCTISNGNAEFQYFSKAAYAGGVYLYYGSSESEFGNQQAVCTDTCSTENPYESPTCQGMCAYATKIVLFSTCKVINNRALWGAAFHVASLTGAWKCIQPKVTITDCQISGNTGSDSIVNAEENYVGIFAAAPESDRPIKQLTFIIVNSNIFNNVASGQAEVYVTFSDNIVGANVKIKGFGVSWFLNTNITNNTGTGLSLRDGTVHVRGTVYIAGNTGILGGGISLINKARLNFHDELHLFIQNNTASLGGGIYIQKQYNQYPQCFFDLGIATIENKTFVIPIEVILKDNKASAGLSIYGGYLDICRITLLFFAEVDVLDAFYHIFQAPNHTLSEITSEVRRICHCIKGEPQCARQNITILTFPGRTFEVEAVPVGQLDGTVPAVVLTTVKDGYEGTLAPQQDAQQIGIECAPLRYSLSSNDPLVYLELQPNAEGPLVEGSLEIGVNFMQCPLGFRLDSSSGVCDCIDFLSQRGVSCDIESLSFQRPVPTWIGFRDGSILAHNRCPFDYCRTESSTITLHNTDPQCAHQRSGILCGGCQEGLSLGFQSSRCRKCSNANVALLLIFIPAGLILVLILIYMDFTVAKGTFNGLVFYANILQIYQNIIFPPGQVNPLTIFIAWLNLDLGIGLCFYDGMDEYGRAWLQFLFPAYIWVIAILIIIGSWYSTLVARIAGRNAVAVLATLFLLSYTKLQRIVLQVLSFTFVTSHNSKQFAVWIYDGNIAYFSAKHAVLLIVALLVLIGFIVPYTLLVLLGPILQGKFGYLMVRFRITPILDAYQGPYELRFRWWPGVMLVLRSILMLAFASNIQGNPRVNMMLILTAIVILLGIVWNTGTILYKKKLNNILEAFYIVNLALLCAWTEFNREASSNFIAAQAAISYTSVSLSLAVFIAVVAYRTYERFRKYLNCLQRLKIIAQKKEEEQELDDYVRECDLPDLRSQ